MDDAVKSLWDSKTTVQMMPVPPLQQWDSCNHHLSSSVTFDDICYRVHALLDAIAGKVGKPIALIPIAMVWLSAVRFARWMLTALGLGKLLNLPDGMRLIAEGAPVDTAWLSSLALGLFAVVMLFTPASNRWFADKGGVDPAVFE